MEDLAPELIIVIIAGAIPVFGNLLLGYLNHRAQKKTNQAVATKNGRKVGQYVEDVHFLVNALNARFDAHEKAANRHWNEISESQNALREHLEARQDRGDDLVRDEVMAQQDAIREEMKHLGD